ncbi:MAG: hypothetical protein LBL19_08570 [Spirochaetaceae bacterium]|jgi:hypothetical protein|nr:hypothetical protein [Spirochaetaceae bacterium]
MKRNCVFILLLAGLGGLFFTACPNPSGGGGNGGGDGSLSIANSSWSDTLVPETTLQFLTGTVTLGGGASTATNNKNWYWGDMDGQTYPYDIVEDEYEILALLDQVEDNWGTNLEFFPDAVVVVWTDFTKKIGFQLHYYAASNGKNYERFICWIDPTHEFKRQ